ncbi:MAG: acyl carrier protein [Kibdelosporangium sp.]
MTAGPDSTPTQVQDWLLRTIAGYLELSPAELDPERPFAEIGLDSVYALTLSADIEDTFGLEVEPTMAWDYPTAAVLAQGIHAQLAAATDADGADADGADSGGVAADG